MGRRRGTKPTERLFGYDRLITLWANFRVASINLAFGRSVDSILILAASGDRPPWLRNLPAEILSAKFTPEFVRRVLTRHLRAPLKAVLLMQKYFPGVGNWMADEILWRAKLPPRLPAGRAGTPKIARTLTATIRRVTRDARRVIAGVDGKLPPDLNVHIPDSWLFNHRWKDGGLCPKTKAPLRREVIGGRTTCWSPTWQRGPK